MLTERANKLVFSLAAMLSLFVTAVSACACSHHQPEQKAEKASCHSAAHEAPAAENAAEPSLSENFAAGCNCFVRNPPPAVTAKSEIKKSSYADHTAPLTAGGPVIHTEFTPRKRVLGPEAITKPYSGRDLNAGPSRAPPRL